MKRWFLILPALVAGGILGWAAAHLEHRHSTSMHLLGKFAPYVGGLIVVGVGLSFVNFRSRPKGRTSTPSSSPASATPRYRSLNKGDG